MTTTTTSYEFKVDMTCQACVNAIKRSLNKTYGSEVTSVEANLETKRVTVKIEKSGDPYTTQQVYDALVKTGRTVEMIN